MATLRSIAIDIYDVQFQHKKKPFKQMLEGLFLLLNNPSLELLVIFQLIRIICQMFNAHCHHDVPTQNEN